MSFSLLIQSLQSVHKNIMLNIFTMCTFPFGFVWLSECACVCPICAYRGRRHFPLSLSAVLCWDRLPHCTGSLLLWTGWLVSKLPAFTVSIPQHGVTVTCDDPWPFHVSAGDSNLHLSACMEGYSCSPSHLPHSLNKNNFSWQFYHTTAWEWLD